MSLSICLIWFTVSIQTISTLSKKRMRWESFSMIVLKIWLEHLILLGLQSSQLDILNVCDTIKLIGSTRGFVIKAFFCYCSWLGDLLNIFGWFRTTECGHCSRHRCHHCRATRVNLLYHEYHGDFKSKRWTFVDFSNKCGVDISIFGITRTHKHTPKELILLDICFGKCTIFSIMFFSFSRFSF